MIERVEQGLLHLRVAAITAQRFNGLQAHAGIRIRAHGVAQREAHGGIAHARREKIDRIEQHARIEALPIGHHKREHTFDVGVVRSAFKTHGIVRIQLKLHARRCGILGRFPIQADRADVLQCLLGKSRRSIDHHRGLARRGR